MLTEKRYEIILKLLEERRSITVPEIKEVLHISESTIRRDLTALDRAGRLVKVFGGAVAAESSFITAELSVAQKEYVNREEKETIARYAAGLIEKGDFVYLDAGTTTGYMIDYITEKQVTFVTNAVSHAKRLAAAGFHVFLVGGELKGTTEAVVGNQAILSIQNFHFTKGFFGTNGISKKEGCTTPDYNEALVKQTALGQSHKAYILADTTKFGNISSVTFALLESVTVLTENAPPEGYGGYDIINVAVCNM
ncbi:MAG: DeoR/GlpR family DNA-binding transcription regulator [Lachnospiraceae bacterium]|nr:DeoR/GlpR family DNA-binding transcription regulator [Lachnospiraceae bacterium]